LETEDEESVRKVYRAADTHLQISMEKKYRRKHIQTKTIHLRPREGKKDHYVEGVMHRIIIKRPLWKEMIYSMIYLKPMMLAGYLRARTLKKLYNN